MIDFNEVSDRLKQVLTNICKKEKILDKDIALQLGLDPQYFAVIKRRKKIPYQSLAYFSHKHKINLNWILLNQKPQYLQ